MNLPLNLTPPISFPSPSLGKRTATFETLSSSKGGFSAGSLLWLRAGGAVVRRPCRDWLWTQEANHQCKEGGTWEG